MKKGYFISILAIFCLLVACTPQKKEMDMLQELPVPETVTPGGSLKAKLSETAKAAEQPKTSGEPDSPGEEEHAGDELPELKIPESLSGETGEQTAVYTQAYSESGLYLVDCIHLYAREDKVYRLEEQIELYLRDEELELDLEPEDLEEMLDMLGEVFQGIMDEYGKSQGVTTNLQRREKQYLMEIVCEVSEETAQSIVDVGFLDIEETSKLLSFQKMCEVLEEENYTQAE